MYYSLLFLIMYAATKILMRFTSNRTNYGKLKKKVKGTKSGSGALKLTRLQQWTLRRYACLDPYMTCRMTEDLGSVSIYKDYYPINQHRHNNFSYFCSLFVFYICSNSVMYIAI